MSGVTLKAIRFFNNMTQAQLCRMTGIHQSKLSLAENGLITLSEGEKMKIDSFLSCYIDWKATESKCDFAMPKIDYSQSKKPGLKIRRLKNASLEKPVIISAGEKEDHVKYTYEPVKDGR